MPLILTAPYRITAQLEEIIPSGSLWGWGQSVSGQLGNQDTGQKNYPTEFPDSFLYKSVAGGSERTLTIREDGTLWACGRSTSDSPLGVTGPIDGYFRTLSQIGIDANWKSISCGVGHNFAIKEDGTLWGWGRNINGQLGNGSLSARSAPYRIGIGTDWKSVTCGSSYTLAIKEDGTLWAWGANGAGNLGLGNTTSYNSPVKVGIGTDWKLIACSSSHVLAIKEDGTLWAWGDNLVGQLGKGHITRNALNYSPVQIGVDQDWKAVACGSGHTVAIKNDGSIWAWGQNQNGELGKANNISSPENYSPVQIQVSLKAESVACGSNYTVVRGLDGTLWAWGSNTLGQLGVSVSNNSNRYPSKIGMNTDWKSIACGPLHTLALR